MSARVSRAAFLVGGLGRGIFGGGVQAADAKKPHSKLGGFTGFMRKRLRNRRKRM
jgi:hypothetical protein